MFPYLVVLFILLLMAILEDTKHDNRKFYLAVLLLLLFAGFRGNGDGDYFKYLDYSKSIRDINSVLFADGFPFEIGYRIIAFIVNILSLNPQSIIIVMAFISTWPWYYLIKNLSKHKVFSVLLYFPIFLFLDMHHTRNAIAVGYGAIFLFMFFKKDYLKAFISFLVALSFHKSAVFLLMFIPLFSESFINLYSRFTLKSKVFFFFFLTIITLILNPIDIIISIATNIDLGNFSEKIISYLSNQRWSYRYYLFDPRFLLLVFTYFLGNIFKSPSKNYFFLDLTIFLAIFIQIVMRSSTILTLRLSHYFLIFTILYIPLIVSNVNAFHFKKIFSDNQIDFLSRTKLFKYLKSSKYDYSTKFSLPILYSFILIYIVYSILLINKQVDYMFFFT